MSEISVGIIGTRGIPNHYGGFEKFVEQLAPWLQQHQCEVTVYCPHNHPEKHLFYKDVKLEYVNNPESFSGTIGQFIYDLFCNIRSRRKKHEVILHFGYTSDSIWWWLWSRKCMHITNMDGLEWKRAKYGKWTRIFLRWAEKLAAKHSKKIVADHPEIALYLKENYPIAKINTISYPVEIPKEFDVNHLKKLNQEPFGYFLTIARIEPENHIELICDAYCKSNSEKKLLIVGGISNKYAKKLKDKFDHKVDFLGAIYENELLNTLKHYSRLYIHGHSVGGTNPGLLEAMACACKIAAHSNMFNKKILDNDALYFGNSEQLSAIFSSNQEEEFKLMVLNNLDKVRNNNTIDIIGGEYLKMMTEI